MRNILIETVDNGYKITTSFKGAPNRDTHRRTYVSTSLVGLLELIKQFKREDEEKDK